MSVVRATLFDKFAPLDIRGMLRAYLDLVFGAPAANVAKIIRACQELPGQELLQYVDEDGKQQDVTSGDVNQYLKEITGQDITAKDFRTWAGTVLAAQTLNEVKSFDTAAQAKRNLRMAIERGAARLGNTPTICRKCYVHPGVLTCISMAISC